MLLYTVSQGDTLFTIGSAYGLSAQTIAYDNQIAPPYTLAVGQALLLDTGSSVPTKQITAGGYAYPFISPYVLRQTLPFLTDLYVFSYGFTSDGGLIPPPADDTYMIRLALQYGVRPILTLTPFDETGQFNNYLISEVINDAAAVENLTGQLLSTISAKGFQGLDIDFEYILPADRDAYAAFVAALTEAVHTLGYETSVALAPKTAADQPGLLYEGKDYAGLAAAADYVLLMTYEWGYRYGPPMSVAPLPQVRRVVEYALTEMPPEKIHLGVPNYGYDWPLPFVSGETEARVVGNAEAAALAVLQNVPISYDTTAQSPYFSYMENETAHVVWFQDVRDYAAKFSLISEYGLRGFSYWTIMQLFRAGLLLCEDTFRISRS